VYGSLVVSARKSEPAHIMFYAHWAWVRLYKPWPPTPRTDSVSSQVYDIQKACYPLLGGLRQIRSHQTLTAGSLVAAFSLPSLWHVFQYPRVSVEEPHIFLSRHQWRFSC